MTNLQSNQAPGKSAGKAAKPLKPADLDHILRQHRERVFDSLYALGITVNLAADNLDIRDYRGFNYSVRRLIAYAKDIRDAANMMIALHRENGHG